MISKLTCLSNAQRIQLPGWVARGALWMCLAMVMPAAFAEEAPKADPLAGAFYPPEVLLQFHGQLELTEVQMRSIRERLEQTGPRFDELRKQIERETAALGEIARQEPVDEAKLIAQLDKTLDLEREAKRLQLGLMAGIKNQLTAPQQAKVKLLAQAMKQIPERAEKIQQLAKEWELSGRDPSAIGKTLEEKVRPLMEAQKPIEALAELDRLLEWIKERNKGLRQ